MSWTITDGTTTTVSFAPRAGSITITHPQEVGVLWALRGSNPFVQAGPLQAATVDTPPWVVDTVLDRDLLVALVGSGRVLTLTADTEEEWTVRSVGPVQVAVADTPDRATKPRFEVQVSLQVVA